MSGVNSGRERAERRLDVPQQVAHLLFLGPQVGLAAFEHAGQAGHPFGYPHSGISPRPRTLSGLLE